MANEPTSSPKGSKTKTISASVEAELKQIPPAEEDPVPTPTDERMGLILGKLQGEIDQINEKVKDMRSDRDMRERYANYAFIYLVGFSAFCVIVLLAQGSPFIQFKLDKEVIITLVGSTAAAAIGLVGWIARGLFRAPGNDD